MSVVLVVEDDADVAGFLLRTLRRMMDQGRPFEVHHASSPTEALAWLGGWHGDAHLTVLSDFNMGAPMNGIELLREIRRRWPGVRRVLMSGYAREEVTAGVEAGLLDAFLPKPWENESLGTVCARAGAR